MKWITAKLGEVTQVLSGTTPKSDNPNYWNGQNIWITPTDLGKLNSYIIDKSERLVTDDGVKSCNLRLIPKNAIVMSSRAPIGHLGIAGCDLYTNQGCKSFVCSKSLDHEFLYFLLQHRMPEIQALGSGATFVEISKTILSNFEISFPVSVSKQQHIAAHLKAQLAEVEKARKAAEMQLQEIKTLFNRILENQIVKALKNGKEKVILGDIAEITAKLVNPELPEFCNLPHVSAKNIEGLTGRLLNIRSAKEDGMTSSKYLFEDGDILYSKLRPYLRKIAQPDFSGLCSADMYPLKCDPKRIDRGFLKILLTSSIFTEYAKEKSARSRMPKLNREQLFEWKFILPSLNQQIECRNSINSASELATEASKAAKSILYELNLLPQKILAQAFEI